MVKKCSHETKEIQAEDLVSDIGVQKLLPNFQDSSSSTKPFKTIFYRQCFFSIS